MRDVIRRLRIILAGVCFYAVFAYLYALVFREPYYQNFLVACLASVFTMGVVVRPFGAITGAAAGIGMMLVHFALAWIGAALTGGATSRIVHDARIGVAAFVLIGVPWILFFQRRHRVKATP